jgi:PKD repeat protein
MVALEAQSADTPITSPRCNEFTFDATGSYAPENKNISFQWDFGDETTSNKPVVTHTYQESGDYAVTLTINDNSGLDCSSATTQQTVRANLPPHAEFAAPAEACVNQQIALDGRESRASNKGGVLFYQWDLGDGTQETGEDRIPKVYTKGGEYKILLTVNDKKQTECSAQSAERTIRINAPPVAQAGEEEFLRCVQSNDDLTITLDASDTRDDNNDDLTYTWNMGDGTQLQGTRVTHSYKKVGTYDVRLVVKDTSTLDCSTGVDFVRVRLNETAKADAGEDVSICAGGVVDFDGSKSYISKKGTVFYNWDFGDGESASSLMAQHVYNDPGNYQATLTLRNELNEMCPVSRDARSITVNSAPLVKLKTVESVCLGNDILFDASASVDPEGKTLEYYWTLGDGTILRGSPSVTHQYQKGGKYRASVIVDDGAGSKCSTASAEAVVLVNAPPVADAGPNLICCVNKEATFNANASNDPDGDQLDYHWDFGDGTTAEGATVQHAYAKSGNYNVALTVDDRTGTACSKSTSGFVANVNTPPIPVISVR